MLAVHRDNWRTIGDYHQGQRAATSCDQRLSDPGRKRPTTDAVRSTLPFRQGPHAGKGGFSIPRYQGQGRDRHGRPGALTEATGSQEPRHDRALRQGADGGTGEAVALMRSSK